jgi:CrcB protein
MRHSRSACSAVPRSGSPSGARADEPSIDRRCRTRRRHRLRGALSGRNRFGPIVRHGLPWGTLIINVTGSFLIGAFIGLFATRWDLSQTARVFLTIGICGGYTTFSTFSLDTFYLIERGEMLSSAAYMIASVVLSVAALIAAIHLVRSIA